MKKMTFLTILPDHMKTLIGKISSKNKHYLLSICQEIEDFQLSSSQRNIFMLWIVKSWYSSETSNSCLQFGGGTVIDVDYVVAIIERLHMERDFCQVSVFL